MRIARIVALGTIAAACMVPTLTFAQEIVPLEEQLPLEAPAPAPTPQGFILAPVTLHAAPASKSDCPEGFPVKGNRNSMIYHVPGGQFYSRTDPEDCYATPEAAAADGFRASQR